MSHSHPRSLRELHEWLEHELSTQITDEEALILLGLKLKNEVYLPEEKMPEIEEEG